MSRYELIRPRKASLWDRFRSFTIGPTSLKDPVLRKYFSGGSTSTGVSVSEYTALNYSAVWSAVNLIAGDVASLPLVLYRRVGKNKERYDSHPLYRLLHDAPNPEMSSITLRQTMQAHVLTWGNGYAEIERHVSGAPKYIWPITPERVQPFRGDSGALVYKVSNPKGADVYLDPIDMIHIPGLGWDGVQGYAPVDKARESVALGLAAERFGGAFYGNGSTFGGVISHPTKFSTPQARQNFEASLKNRHKGVDRAHGLLLLEEGMEYAQIGIPPDQAQFLESRQFQITEIARWFNVPPHKIGDLSRATFSNIEQQNIEYFQTTLIHWLEAWEQELMRKLISPLERNQQFIEHVVEGLLRGDSAGRAQLEQAEFRIGGLTPNESRALSNRNPVDGGDEAFVSMDAMPLSVAREYWQAQIESLKAKAQPPTTPAGDDADRAALRVAVTALEAAREAEALEKRQAQQRAEDLSAALAHESERADTATADLTRTMELLDGARTALAAAEAERIREVMQLGDDYARGLAEKDATIATEREKAEVADTEARAAQAAQVTAEAARERAELDQARAEQAKGASDFAREALETELTQTRANHAERVAGILVAHRGLIVDVMQRMVEREIDRAKRHQATPQKFRAWVDTFYRTHGDAIAEALLPAVKAHLSILSSNCDPHDMARQLAADHVAESEKQLRDLLHVEDFAPMLERTLAQWETSRPEMVADRLLTKGLADVR